MYKMILNVLIFKNKRLDCFTQPQFDDHAPEVAAIQLSRSLKLNIDNKNEAVKSYRFLDLYLLGTFNDETGKIELLDKPRLLLNCSKVLGLTEEQVHGKDN